MSNRDDYEKELEVIKGIDNDRLKAPHHIPVEVYIQEAKIVHEWAMNDIEALISIGLSRELLEDLPIRIGALTQAESLLYVQRNSGDDAVKKWASQG